MPMPAYLRVSVFGIAIPVGVIAGIIALTFLATAGMRAGREEAEKAPTRNLGLAVFTEIAQRQDVRLSVTTQGEARPRREIDLVPQVAGRIVYVSDNFIEGGFFDAGEALIRIEDADYKLAVIQAEASVARARRALEAEQAQAELARRDWEDLGRGPASRLTLREPQLAEARAELASAEAMAADARLQLSRTVLSAPFAGRVRTQDADLGQYITPGQSLGRVFASDVVEVRLPLTDDELALLGLPAAFSAEDSGAPAPQVVLSARLAGVERRWSARIARTESAIDPMTRTLFAIAEVADPYGAGAAADGAPLPIGLFVEAEISGRTINDAYQLPREALRRNDEIYIANRDGTLSIREVEVVTSNDAGVIISSGVQTGEHVIISPLVSPSDGLRVQVFDNDGALLFPQPDAADNEAIAELPADEDRS